MTKIKKWLLTFLIVITLGLIGVAGLTIYVDPFFQYHKPLDWFPYLVDHQMNMNPGLAENMEYLKKETNVLEESMNRFKID